jgi:F0F1-type ATP synthase membrane subunit c/vacuolar-type H+-ATPase subunit K
MLSNNLSYIIVIGIMITLGGAAVGTGILFCGFLLGGARNPEDLESLFSYALIGFALIETFVFFALLIGSFFVFF